MNNGGVNLQQGAVKTQSAGSCCNACLAAQGCAGYTYLQASGECWLKSSTASLSPDQYATSGSVTQAAALAATISQVVPSDHSVTSQHHEPLAGFVAGSSSSLTIRTRPSQPFPPVADAVPAASEAAAFEAAALPSISGEPAALPSDPTSALPAISSERAALPSDQGSSLPATSTPLAALPSVIISPPPVVAAAPQAACSPAQHGMNNGGTNLQTTAVSASSIGDCCNACLREPSCAGYTLVEAKSECWLKSSVQSPAPDQYATSGNVDRLSPQTSAPLPSVAGGVPPVALLANAARQPLAPLMPPLAPRVGTMGWSQAAPSKGHVMLAGEKSAKLLGKTLRMNIDVSQVGCGCVTGVYLVERGDGGQCDASGTFPERCGEIDLFEGNQFAWHTTLHEPMDHPGVAGGFGGLQQADMMYGKGPRDMTGEQYGPGGLIIDTARPFHAAISFPQGTDGSLIDMVVMLYQDGNSKAIEWRVNKNREDRSRSPPLTCEDSSCKECYSKPGCVYQQTSLQKFGKWLSDGMTPLSTYWGGPSNTWIDAVMDDERGGCSLGQHGTAGTENYGGYLGGGGCYGAAYNIGGFTVEDISDPGIPWEQFLQQMDASAVINQ